MRNAMLAKVHIAKKSLGLTDEDYAAWLKRCTGKTSAKDCSGAELDRLLAEFRRQGFRPKKAARISGKPHVRKVYALWGELERSGALREPTSQALNALVMRQTGVASADWLTASQANLVTEALKAMLKRHQEHAA